MWEPQSQAWSSGRVVRGLWSLQWPQVLTQRGLYVAFPAGYYPLGLCQPLRPRHCWPKTLVALWLQMAEIDLLPFSSAPPPALSLSLFDLFVFPCHRISPCLLLCGSQDQTQAIKSGSKYLSH